MNRATMSDVANLAGVSLKSVSRVVNREPNVSSVLRGKVEAAIAELAYVPDLAARSLAGARALAIGLLFDDFGDAFMPSYFPKAQSGVQRACRDNGYHLVVETFSSLVPDFAEALARMLQSVRIDGFVLTPPYSDNAEAMNVFDSLGIPYSRIAPFADIARAPYVAIDDAAAASEMARYLWDLGHRRFGFVSGKADHSSAQARRKGFYEALAALGCGEIVEAYAGFQFELGIGAAREIMERDDPPTAIFAANDDSAAGVMTGLVQLGLKVPDDVSVAGFDNSWITESVWPYLTTVHQPIAEMGYVAAMQLIGRGNGGSDPTDLPEVATRLIVRGSTAGPKAS
jgi:LacI family transcriptional regulator